MKEFETTILMEPVGKGRPRVVRHADNVITYTPDKTAAAEELIRVTVWEQHARDIMSKPIPASTPLSMELDFYMRRPKSVKREYPTVKPDIDNCVKLVEDALQGFLFDNDSQVVSLTARKRYSEGLPRIEIRVREIE